MGKVQEGERLLPRSPASAGRRPSGMRVREKPKRVLPARRAGKRKATPDRSRDDLCGEYRPLCGDRRGCVPFERDVEDFRFPFSFFAVGRTGFADSGTNIAAAFSSQSICSPNGSDRCSERISRRRNAVNFSSTQRPSASVSSSSTVFPSSPSSGA